MTIDEEIAHQREVAEKIRTEHNCECDYYDIDIDCAKCAEEHEQLAEWLEELKVYRTLDKTNFSDGYNKAIDDFVEKINYTAYTPVCVDCMTKNQIIELAEQLKH